MGRMVSLATTLAVLITFSPVFGQDAVPAVTSPAPVSSTPAVEGSKQGERSEVKKEREGRGKGKRGKGRGRGHGKKRGLDRADEMAGEHGQQGRGRARGQGRHRDKEKHDEGEQQDRD